MSVRNCMIELKSVQSVGVLSESAALKFDGSWSFDEMLYVLVCLLTSSAESAPVPSSSRRLEAENGKRSDFDGPLVSYIVGYSSRASISDSSDTKNHSLPMLESEMPKLSLERHTALSVHDIAGLRTSGPSFHYDRCLLYKNEALTPRPPSSDVDSATAVVKSTQRHSE